MTRMRRSDSDVDSDPTSEVTARSQTSLWRRKHPMLANKRSWQ